MNKSYNANSTFTKKFIGLCLILSFMSLGMGDHPENVESEPEPETKRNVFKEFIDGIELDPKHSDDKSQPLFDKKPVNDGAISDLFVNDFPKPNHYIYLDPVNGNDKNDGRSENAAWKTLDKLNQTKLKKGTSVRFKRGSTFRGLLITQSGVTYENYGQGSRPMLLGSVEINDPQAWRNEGGNIWSTGHPSFSFDVGNIIFNNGQSTGVKVFDRKKVKNDRDFWWDKNSKRIFLYSSSNPAQRWSDIECAITRGIVAVKDVRQVQLRGIDFLYTGGHAINIENSGDVLIEDCHIAFAGGGNLFSLIGRPGVKRFGNGVEIYATAKNILVQNNTLEEIYDAALTNQSYEKQGHQNNIIYRNNSVDKAEYCFEIWYYARKSSMKNVLFENNICKGSGRSWGHEQRPDEKNGRNVMVFGNIADTDNIIIRKNKFYKASHSNMRFADPKHKKDFTIYENTEL